MINVNAKQQCTIKTQALSTLTLEFFEAVVFHDFKMFSCEATDC